MEKMQRKGFTLIELLVVISIIALLLSILMPGLQKAKNTAKKMICKSNLKQWNLVASLYTTDYNSTYWQGWDPTLGQDSVWWMIAGEEYIQGVDEVKFCPTATKVTYNRDGSQGPGFERAPFAAWGYFPSSADPDVTIEDSYESGSYTINGWLESGTDLERSSNPTMYQKRYRKLTAVSMPSNVPFMTDGQWVETWPEASDFPPPEENFQVDYASMAPGMFNRVVQNRHGGKQNVAYADFSVSDIGLKGLWTLKWYKDFNTRGDWVGGGARTSSWPEWMQGLKDY